MTRRRTKGAGPGSALPAPGRRRAPRRWTPPVARALALLLLGLQAGCSDSPSAPDDPGPSPVLTPGVESYTYEIVAEYPHDPEAFTQGLVSTNGMLFEGTGLRGRSELRRVDLETGEVLQRHELDPSLFGEGITTFGDDLIQLTWTSNVGFVYDRESFATESEFSYPTEGWGVTHDGVRLIMSDGTSTLHMLDPQTFETTGSVPVRDEDGSPVDRLNELEYIEGHVFANVWLTDRIAIIDPGRGEVEAWLDLGGLLPPEDRPDADVLNGIAFDPATGHLLVTGKLWPRLYEIELVPADGP